MTQIIRSCCAFFVALCIMSALSPNVASAANILWDGTGTSWNAVGSWSQVTDGPIPNPVAIPGAADLAIFNTTTVNTAQTVNLNGPQFARGLVFNSTGTVSIP